MRWGRRRFQAAPKKIHYYENSDEYGNAIALCKKEYDGGVHITNDLAMVNCKTCIKKLLKSGLLVEENVPSYLRPSPPKSKTVEDSLSKDTYLKRLGVF